jgi:glyoxylase-like metal-dependent hydrolase (beta-lactamase superfamily II)
MAAFILFAAAKPIAGQSARRVTQLASGVYAIEHRDALDGFAGGNTTVVIGERQALVIDASFLPSEAREDIAQIRRWTDKPVSFLLNTHFHNDHNLGNRAYMEAFPAVTIIAHVETKLDMDLFGPGSLRREEQATASYQQMLERGKTSDGNPLTEADRGELKRILARRTEVMEELRPVAFQSATLTFDHDFTVDIGNRLVEIKFLGRGNTAGDAVAYLPKERIVVAGDLVVHPIPFFYDGYPSEWSRTLQRLLQLDAGTIVPGHGAILHDQAYPQLLRDLLRSAVEQVNEALRNTGPAMFRTVDAVRGSVDLSPFRERFAGNDKDLAAAFDEAAGRLVNVVFREASLR